MAIPANVTTIRCRLDTRRLGDGTPSSGRLVFVPGFRCTVTDPATSEPVLLVGPNTAPIRAELVDGVAEVVLVATDDPDATYSGVAAWTVHERFPGGRTSWALQVPWDGGDIDLATAIPAEVGPIVTTYALADHTHALSAADVGAAAASHTHAAGDVTSGTIGTARLGSGSASSATFLRGDQTWAVPAGGGGEVRAALDATGDPYHYMGTAPAGSAESATVWTIGRIGLTGAVGAVTHASGVAWSNRESEAYA